MEEDIEYEPIMQIPNEIISMILQHLKCRDIIYFGSTCKKFHAFVNNNQYLWKAKLEEILPAKIHAVVKKHGDGNSLDEIKKFFTVRKDVYNELFAMSPKYYWRLSDLCLDDMQNFFRVALRGRLEYHYVIYVLQLTLLQEREVGDYKNEIQEFDFTMTHEFYAKIIIRFLTQTFLTLKWVHGSVRKELTPETIVNFFVQWADPLHWHSEFNIETCIDVLVSQVETLFVPDKDKDKDPPIEDHMTVKERLAQGMINEKQVLEAVSKVIYTQMHVTIMEGTSLHGLDLIQVLSTRCGNLIIVAVIYQTVARQCGVHCELIAFPNHLFLEWRNPLQDSQIYKIDLESGMLVPQGRCPFAPPTFRKEYTFNSDGFLQYIISSFLMTMGAIKNVYTQNALCLMDFLTNNTDADNPYRGFRPYLESVLDFTSSPALDTALELENIPDDYLQIISNLKLLTEPSMILTREIKVMERHSAVKYAVGMVVCHKKSDYVGVVRGWDLRCTSDWRRRVEFKGLELGSMQPFYSVIAVDQSERYIAQENVLYADPPRRLHNLEDVIAKEFADFDGYCYVPNKEKENEYPQDGAVRAVYRMHMEQKRRKALE